MNSQTSGRGLAMAIVIAAYILSFFHRFAPAGIAQDLALAFQTSAASLGALAATYFYVYTLMQVPTGILVDTLGARRILVIGSLIAAAGSGLFGMADGLQAALVGRTLIGLGVSVVFIAMLKLIAVWFDERRFATLVGLAMLLGNLGSMLAGAPLAALAEHVSWRGIYFALAAISVLIAVGSFLLIQDQTTDTDAKPRFDRTVIVNGLNGVLRNRATWPAVWTNFGLAGSFFAFAGLWATPYLVQVHKLTRVEAASHLSLYFAGFAVGCLAIGSLSDRLGRRKPVLIGASLLYFLLWLVWLSAVRMPIGLTYTLFGLMGIATASFALTWACAKEVNPPQLSGMSTSVTNMGGFLAGALLQPAVGAIMDLGWDGTIVDGVRIYSVTDFRLGIGLIALAGLIGLLSSLFLRETGCRNIWRPATP
ncbi:MFS transporter [Azoarcus communis]|uniref:Lysosomal dipeptide transporter MFSD1 n=2 Tax=root TaxID=1 RepID=A0A323UUY0_9RHOO|nr:MFS transporter [Parazoarcus communis]NMG46595.1 MFS transporter [Parazoarcus communis]NMG68928.1 MFS transporter [Parazoarcus communis SWub3 = DSM 12120]PZA16802.1 MFS transporter [Azoarcus communis] [Parazoarcus communis SWub3 = DSM 12120]